MAQYRVFRRYWNGARRKLPITATGAPVAAHQVVTRRPPYRHDDYVRHPWEMHAGRRAMPETHTRALPIIRRVGRRFHPAERWHFFTEDRHVAEFLSVRSSGDFPVPEPPPLTETGEEGTEHWWLDMEAGGFWKFQFAHFDYDPRSVMAFPSLADDDKSDVIVGSDDGYLRHMDRTLFQDDETAFISKVMIGPVPIGQGGVVGLVEEIQTVLTDDSGDVTWELRANRNHEDAATESTSSVASGTWTGGGLNPSNRPRRRGAAFTILISNAETNDGWSVEEVGVTTSERGMRR